MSDIQMLAAFKMLLIPIICIAVIQFMWSGDVLKSSWDQYLDSLTKKNNDSKRKRGNK